MKCNARETWPNPCARCKSQGTDCRMDSSFRSVPARRQLEEVSQKLNNLQRLLDSNQTGQREKVHSMKYTGQSEQDSPAAVAAAPGPTRPAQGLAAQMPLPGWSESAPRILPPSFSQPGFLHLQEESSTNSWTLGGITVTYHVAKALFTHFNDHKWHHIPVLQVCTRLQDLFASSDLLFWTIILQAARNHGLYGSYYLDLLPHHRLLLGASLLGVSHPRTMIAAICLRGRHYFSNTTFIPYMRFSWYAHGPIQIRGRRLKNPPREYYETAIQHGCFLAPPSTWAR